MADEGKGAEGEAPPERNEYGTFGDNYRKKGDLDDDPNLNDQIAEM